ncbi:PAS domain-containing sensor histidine kinase [Haloferax sp. MBLA0076]|uniref:histidine kinase n=1 Tax=Haloferax litoreum TaxID=2666140 RepID=A0A6A8GIB5_9EURY|nr:MULTISPECIES: histidine kinase N-terminal 7TM domain-containing protein [Haloferax]KAB1194361.1 PAS domain-containing sensor histidine kinase [Haloferax sp. CBA1148]MRX22923.1 PAS domain-containing sensor histidine kinase [Haloferax litoreum]
MEWQHTLYAYPMVFAAVVAAILTGYAIEYTRRNGRNPIAVSFAALTATVTFWTALTTVKLLVLDPAAKLLAYKFLHVGAALAPPTFLVFALAYTDRHEWLDRRIVSSLYVVPVVFLAVLFSNPRDLGYTGVEIATTDGVATLSVIDGPVSVFGLVYGFVVLFVALGILTQYALELDRTFRTQSGLLLVGMAVPTVVAIFELTDTPPFGGGVNLIPASLAVPAVTFGLAASQFKLLDILPLAHATIGEHVTDGLVVLDTDEVVVHTNDHVADLLGTDESLVGTHASAAIPRYDELGGGRTSVDVLVDGNRYVEVTRIPLEQPSGLVGWVLSIRDVSLRKQHELSLESRNDELEVLNRIVRHDIRNDMQLVTSYIELVMDRESLASESRTYLETAHRRAQHTVELTDLLGQLIRASNDDERRYPVDAGAVLTSAVESVRDGYPNANISVDDAPTAIVLANDLLDSVFVNILKNAVVHSDLDEPTIDISVVVDDETVCVDFADDGPGIPDDRKPDVFEKDTKGLESPGTGTGLYLVETIVSNFSGTVSIADNDPRGTSFSVELPLAEPAVTSEA